MAAQAACIGGSTIVRAPVGHASMHDLQAVQSSVLTTALPVTRLSAPTGHAATHSPQPVQASRSMRNIIVCPQSPDTRLNAASRCDPQCALRHRPSPLRQWK